MRAIHHPPIASITVESILHAFSDPVRIQIFADLAKAECAKNCSSYLTLKKQTLPKSTLSQHFRILREAGLIHSTRQGVEMVNTTRCAELKPRFGAMIEAIVAAYLSQAKHRK
jgi:DNA-binding transcriptional ArsR family regulator